MKNMNFMYLMDMIDDKYIVEAKMLPKVKVVDVESNRFISFFSGVMSVAAAVIVFGAIIIWTLVGKDILSNEQGDDTSNVTTAPIITTEPDTEPDDPIIYSEGLEFALNEENDGYKVVGIGKCRDSVINIPPTYNGMPVTEIRRFIFPIGPKIVEVNIPYGVKTIGINAFNSCTDLKKVTIPNSVTLIDEDAFSHCTSLKTVDIPESVTKIGARAFSYCTSLKRITIPGSCVNTGQGAFEYCTNLKEATLNEGVEEISAFSFSHCTSLTDIEFPNSLSSIDFYAFSYCESLSSITLPESVKSLGIGIFEYCTNLENAIINAKVKSFSGGHFTGCEKLESITFGEGIEQLDSKSTYNLISLKQVFLPNSIKSITNSNLIYRDVPEVTYNGTIAEWNAIIKGDYKPLDILVPIHCIDGTINPKT